MGLLDDYSRQAVDYDKTRGVSRSVIDPLRSVLKGAPGPRLADIGGGTGNYAVALRDEDFDAVVIDRSARMLERAQRKGLKTIEANAEELPLDDGSFDVAILLSMLHHVDDRREALDEARRILVGGGILAALVFTMEDAESLWLLDRFPVSRPWMTATHPPREEIERGLPGARRLELTLTDLADGSVAALSSRPDLILDRSWRSQTSYFERLERDHPAELAAGLDRLRVEVEAGSAPCRPGRASLFTWTKPAR